MAKSKDAVEIPLDKIVPDPDQPREEFDPEALERLAESLKTRGQLQPIRVRWDEAQGKYVIICGERRWRAARMAGLATMSCVVSEGPIDAGELLALQLIENCLREDLRPIEQARAFKSLMDRNGWSGNQARQGARHRPADRRAGPGPAGAARAGPGAGGAGDPAAGDRLRDRQGPRPGDPAGTRRARGLGGTSRTETMEAVRVAAKRTPSTLGKGRGAGRSRKVPTSRTLKAAGCKITVEHRKGVDDELLAAALREALDQIEARRTSAA